MTKTGPTPKGAGRVARKRSAVRARLLMAGLHRIAEDGVKHMTVSSLAKASDCSVGAFYTHFDSKEEFVEVMYGEFVETVGDALDAYQAAVGDARKAMSVSLRFTLGVALELPEWGRFVTEIAWSKDALRDGFGGRVLRDIREGMEAGHFEVDDEVAALGVVAGSFMASVLGASLGLMSADAPEQAAKHVLLALGVPKRKARALATSGMPQIVLPEQSLLALELARRRGSSSS